MNYSFGETKKFVENDDLVEKNLIKHWKNLRKRPNIIGIFLFDTVVRLSLSPWPYLSVPNQTEQSLNVLSPFTVLLMVKRENGRFLVKYGSRFL